MQKLFFFFSICFAIAAGIPCEVSAQKETYDIVSYTPPAGWQKEIKENLTSYTIVNKKSNAWCQVGIVKSTISKGNIEKDFDSEWQELIVDNYKPAQKAQVNKVKESGGWKIKTGTAKFQFNNADAVAMLTTMSGYTRCVSIVMITNSQNYMKDVESLMASVDLTKPQTGNTVSNPVQTGNVVSEPVQTGNRKFAFTTTNFDDGWVSTAQEDWVQVTKGTTRILVHYPNREADKYNSVAMDGLKNAWNILVAPKYSSASNFEFKPISGWQTIEFAEADAVEKGTGKTVHVVLFKMNYSNGSGKYLEFITPDKASFEKEFGAYHQNTYGWEKMENMAFYNKFAVAASDLQGKWTSNFGGAIQYVNAYTGFDAGMDTHASVENFKMGPGTAYSWDLGVASGPVGNIKFQSVKSSGKFSVVSNWQVNFSDIEGKARNYNVYFSCIKGLRILWLDNRPFAKAE